MGKRSTNCFISYHHNNDQDYLEELRELKMGMKFSDYSLKLDIGHLEWETIYRKIRAKMRLCSVTIVLVGSRTGHREWVDWELWASLRPYTHPFDPNKSFKPNGLLVIYLPVNWSHSIPDRLQDNIDSGYAVEMNWEDVFNKKVFQSKIRKAYNRRSQESLIDNRRKRQEGNDINFLGFKI
jgi:hypothetical protein